MKHVYFDMDGTLADLYGFKNWLEYLLKEDATPYAEAKPLMNLSALAREIHRGQKLGIKYGIISWTSKGGTPAYNKAVEEVKKHWLRRHLPSVVFDEIHVIEYGKPKSMASRKAFSQKAIAIFLTMKKRIGRNGKEKHLT